MDTIAHSPQPPATATDRREGVTWRRLRGPAAAVALTLLSFGALATAVGAVLAGRLAEGVTASLLAALAATVVSGAILDTIGRYQWAGLVDRAEGRLREDLLDAALAQPLAELTEQAVGEVLDRVDDDTREVGSLLRMQVWTLLRALVTSLPVLVVATLTWWPAVVLFPLAVLGTVAAVRPLLPAISERKVAEEAAWTDHAAALEEGIAGRDDLRTSLGQAFAVQRLAALSAIVHERFVAVLRLERQVTIRGGVLLHALLTVVAASGVVLTVAGALSVAQLVTLFAVTSTFVGHRARVADQWPDLQAGLGAVLRLRAMLALAPEPVGGLPVPTGCLPLRFSGVQFSYPDDGAARPRRGARRRDALPGRAPGRAAVRRAGAAPRPRPGPGRRRRPAPGRRHLLGAGRPHRDRAVDGPSRAGRHRHRRHLQAGRPRPRRPGDRAGRGARSGDRPMGNPGAAVGSPRGVVQRIRGVSAPMSR